MNTSKTNNNDRPTTYQADIHVPASGPAIARLVHVDLDQSETAEVQSVADRCGMTLDALIRCYLLTDRMLAWPGGKNPRVYLESSRIKAGTSKQSLARLERAAALFNQSVEEFIQDAINQSISGVEDSMLLNPKTGELLGWNEIGSLLRRKEEAAPRPLPPLPEVEPGGYAALHHVAPTEKKCGFDYRVVFSAKQAEHAQEIAQAAELNLPEFMQAFFEGRFDGAELANLAVPELTDDEEIAILNEIDRGQLARLKRVAEFKGVSLGEVIADDVDSTIECYENDWLYHPQTGEIIGDRPDWFTTPDCIIHRLMARPLNEAPRLAAAQP